MTAQEFQPLSVCLAQNQSLIWLHAISDILLMIAYALVPLTAIALLLQRMTTPKRWIVLGISLFVIADSTTYAFHLWNLWNAEHHWAAAIAKFATAGISLILALLIGPLIWSQLDPRIDSKPQDTPTPSKTD